ncbi:hypothetical protein MNEG_4680 [Monoraphidium neglectum]|uniref:Agd3 deacetylase domain-containing protein n=1 Tax=Monoraphidium neglectum TaxID=145388 RepID=A0A0D2L8V7_9CHLO|nr:hypothetical protein MNEG_4680 [Monoraphidium neglectum]KIZ03274.1 hypothetical protein MNEG_4680 [Monoraphidium neglectum]|eukprot:XP_013902293.1 hypothetical protein MNEG_4680 [Monoraphidium neglectum]
MADCPADAHWFCRSCTKDWKRVPGAPGVAYATPPDTSKWTNQRFLDGDPMYRLLKTDPRYFDAFFWSSHTFSHPMLDNATFDFTKAQMDMNARMAGPDFLGLTSKATFSRSSMVTPSISGLFNADSLAALAASGVTAVAGDNTWPVLTNRANPHHVLYTTQETNGYPYAPGAFALAITPRWATAMAYSASSAQEALDLYNSEVAAPDKEISLQNLLWKEAERVLTDGLLSLRHDGHMFHQANMRVAGSGGAGSLLMMWTETVLARLLAVVDWPVTSLKLDDLAAAFMRREARDNCRLSHRLGISRASGTVQYIAVTSGAAAAAIECGAPLITPRGVGVDGNGTSLLAAVGTAAGYNSSVVRLPAGGSALLRVSGALPWALPPRV